MDDQVEVKCMGSPVKGATRQIKSKHLKNEFISAYTVESSTVKAV